MTAWAVPGYARLRVLGSGGFGEVVLARHDATGTLVAIKYLRGDLLADPGFTEMFRAEAAMLAALADPNIVRLYEYIESPAGAAIVMELVDGVSLRQILANQGATTAEAALVVLQGSLLGLAAAHQRGVVHRDYKPENVLVDAGGGSKLTDFGIAARAGNRPLPAGTVAYVAPEQIAGAPATPAGDVYAATATFYECLTGAPPFAGDTARVLAAHQHAPVPLEPVPVPMRPLVAAGMAKDPRWRPADARTLVTALQAAAGPAYGPDWAARGRSHLGEAALLLAALWPSAAAPATQATTVQRVSLVRRAGMRVSPAKAFIAAGVVVAVAAGGVVVANTVSHHHAGHHHTAAPPPIQRTALVELAPVTPSGQPKAGETIIDGGSAKCEAGSDSVGQAYRCFAGNSIYDPCWLDNADPGQATVLCQETPWDTKIIRLSVPAGGLEPFYGPPLPINRGFPWGVQLSDGEKCIAEQGAHGSYRGKVIDYACGRKYQHVLLRTLDRSSPQWTYQSAYFNGTTGFRPGPLVHVSIAWYANPDNGAAVDSRSGDCTATALAYSAQAYEASHNTPNGPLPDINAQACDSGYAEAVFTQSGPPAYTATYAFKATPSGWRALGYANFVAPGQFGIPANAANTISSSLSSAPRTEQVAF